MNDEPWKSTVYIPLSHRKLELRDDRGKQLEGWHDGATFFPVGVEVKEWRYYKIKKV